MWMRRVSSSLLFTVLALALAFTLHDLPVGWGPDAGGATVAHTSAEADDLLLLQLGVAKVTALGRENESAVREGRHKSAHGVVGISVLPDISYTMDTKSICLVAAWASFVILFVFSQLVQLWMSPPLLSEKERKVRNPLIRLWQTSMLTWANPRFSFRKSSYRRRVDAVIAAIDAVQGGKAAGFPATEHVEALRSVPVPDSMGGTGRATLAAFLDRGTVAPELITTLRLMRDAIATESDVEPPPHWFDVEEVFTNFQKHWKEEVEKGGGDGKLPRALSKTLGWGSLCRIICCTALQRICNDVLPVCVILYAMSMVEKATEHPEDPYTCFEALLKALALCFGIPMLGLIAKLFQFLQDGMDCAMTTSIILSALHHKAQRLPPTKDDHEGGGEKVDIAALVGTDVYTAAWKWTVSYSLITVLPFIFVILFTLAFVLLGWITGVVLLIVFVLNLLAQGSFIPALLGYNGSYNKSRDKRLALFQEMVNGIRIVKSYAWEKPMMERLVETRENEELKSAHGVEITIHKYMNFLQISTRVLQLIAALVYCLTSDKIEPARMFASLQVVGTLATVALVWVNMLQLRGQQKLSQQRIEKFLTSPESARSTRPLSLANEPGSVQIRVRGSFKWNHQDAHPSLGDVDLSIKKGALVGVIGEVGSGKSTLIHTILGELHACDQKAEICCPDHTAYCAQTPWIFEGTLRENVLFGQPLDEARYKKALDASALADDLTWLPGGDNVSIGSKGISLSGGQKARVALARAAYRSQAEAFILDDPFAAVDVHTGKHIFEELLMKHLAGRTRVVSMQPDRTRLVKFDHIIVVSKPEPDPTRPEGYGPCKVVYQGPPAQVMAQECFRELEASPRQRSSQRSGQLSSHRGASTARSMASAGADECLPSMMASQTIQTDQSEEVSSSKDGKLREAEKADYISMETFKYYLSNGGPLLFASFMILSVIGQAAEIPFMIILALWSSHADETTKATKLEQLGLLALLVIFVYICKNLSSTTGVAFSARAAKNIHQQALESVIRAPVDRFYDKHPVGRIIGRFSTDIGQLDMTLWRAVSSVFFIVGSSFIPALVNLALMPTWWTALIGACLLLHNIPFVHAFLSQVSKIRFLTDTRRALLISSHLEVMHGASTVRAYKEEKRLSQEERKLADTYTSVQFFQYPITHQWVLVRFYVLGCSMFTLHLSYVFIYPDTYSSIGLLGMIIMFYYSLLGMVEGVLGPASDARMEFAAVERIREYAHTPQESALEQDGDRLRHRFSVQIPPGVVVPLTVETTASGEGDARPAIRLCTRDGKAILETSQDGSALVAVGDLKIRDVAPGERDLEGLAGGALILSANGERSLSKMGECLARANKDGVTVEVHTGWMRSGASLNISGLRAGYADGDDVLKGFNLSIERKQRAAIVGATGCGKSSLFLVLLRMLEPRAGRIELDGVETTTIGLHQLRSVVGLVPQDPVLFKGTLKHNIDPLKLHTTAEIRSVLKLANLETWVAGLDAGIAHQIQPEGVNVSQGQRQLICLCRMLLRQPGLLLLDEATSALDPHTQSDIQKSITRDFTNSTILAIAHRIETIADFDVVAVLDKGVVIEKGVPKELQKNKDSAYAAMVAKSSKSGVLS